MKKPPSTYRCPCGATLSLIGGKYKIVILWFLYQNSVIPSFLPRWNIP